MRCLLFRMGDFYEMFGEDAERAAALLGLTLTSRDKGADARADGGISPSGPRLVPGQDRPGRPARGGLRAGGRSARGQGAGQARRGPDRHARERLTDDELLDPRTANYLAAVVEAGGKLGLAWVELSTGRFSLTGLLRTELVDEIARLNPAEILISELSLDAPWAADAPRPIGVARSRFARRGTSSPSRPGRRSSSSSGRRRWPGSASTIAASRCRRPGALMAYLRETQKTSLGHITRLIPYRRADTLALDEMTRRSLELVRTLREGKREGSLLSVIDCSATPMGARLLVGMADVALDVDRVDRRAARRRRGAVQRSRPCAAICGACWASRTTWSGWRRGSAPAGRRPRDLVALAKTLAILPKLKARLTARVSKRLNQLEAALELCPEIRAEIEAALVRRPTAGGQGRGPDPRRLSRRPRRAARQCQGGQVVDRQVSGRAGPAHGHPEPQGRIQQGFRLLHRDHARPGAGPRRRASPTITSASRRSRTPSGTSRRS